MGKHSAAPRRRRRSFFRKYRLHLSFAAVLILIVGITVTLLVTSDPYKKVLSETGIKPDDYHRQKQTVTVTFDNDAEGVLLCRDALNAWRSSENPPKTVHWIIQGETSSAEGTVEELTYVPATASSRVETLKEEITRVKLNFELGQSNLSADVGFRPTVGIEGKTVTVRIETEREDLDRILNPALTAVKTVNEEGGGIVRCNLEFTENGTLFAAASYDFLYGDAILSSAFQSE